MAVSVDHRPDRDQHPLRVGIEFAIRCRAGRGADGVFEDAKGCLRDADELRIGVVVLVDPEHQLETRRIFQREPYVSGPLLGEPLRRILATPLVRRLERRREIAEAEQRHFGEQPLGVVEMVRRRRGRNPDAARRFAQRKALHAALRDDLLRRGDQFVAQVAVVIGLPRRPLCGPPPDFILTVFKSSP